MVEKLILIVDDDGSILSVLKNSLKKLGKEYRVITATSGFEALDRIRENNFDLIFTDYKMAGMDGLQLLEKVHSIQPETRVILMTAYGSAGVEAESERLKAYRYLAKPIEIETFRQIVIEATSKGDSSQRGFLVLSERDYSAVINILTKLQEDINASCIFLTDMDGRFIARTGNTDNLPLAKISSLLGGSIATLIEAGRNFDDDDDVVSLAYREGKQRNLFVFNIGIHFLLIIIIQRNSASSKLGSVWFSSKMAITALREKIKPVDFIPSDNVLGGNPESVISTELEKIFSVSGEDHSTRPVEEPVESSKHPSTEENIQPSEKTTETPASERLLNLDQALSEGLISRDVIDKFTPSMKKKDSHNDK